MAKRQNKNLKSTLRLAIAGLVLSTLLSAPGMLSAAPNDFTLWRMCQRFEDASQPGLMGACLPEPGQVASGISGLNQETRALADKGKFTKFARELSAVLAPKYHAPADTLGMAGFNLGFEYTLSTISSGSHWDDALEGVERFSALDASGEKSRSAKGYLSTIQFHIRKGLPYSFEIGFNGSYLLYSKMFMFNLEFTYAFLEDFDKYAPDLALRMTYGRLFGATDLEMDQVGWNLMISKAFSAAGVVELTPYGGYSLVLSIIKPGVVNPLLDLYSDGTGGYILPSAGVNPDATNNGLLLKLPDRNEVIHRGVFGLRMIVATFHFAPEIELSSASVYSFSFNMGAEF